MKKSKASSPPLKQTASIHLQAYGLANFLPGMVKAGLREFWLSALPGDAAVAQLLQQHLREDYQELGLDWSTWRETLIKLLNHENTTPLARIISDCQLEEAELFVLALVGEVEHCHLTNLAIGELQAPDQNPRPKLHLIAALIQVLFPEYQSASTAPIIAKLANQNLVRQGILSVDGDGPLPLQAIRIAGSFWSVLLQHAAYWPECEVLAPAHSQSTAMQTEVRNAVALLDYVSPKVNSFHTGCTSKSEPEFNPTSKNLGLVVRGHPHSGRHAFAAALAEQLGLVAMAIPYKRWCEQAVLAPLCLYAGWLPVIDADIAPGESISPPHRDHQPPMVIITNDEGAIHGKHFVEINLSIPPQQEREIHWRRFVQDKSLCQQVATALLSKSLIEIVGVNAERIARQSGEPLNIQHIGRARQRIGAERLRLLAQPVFRQVNNDAIVMPTWVRDNLQLIIERAHAREMLSQGLGSTLAATANPGLRALFVGESGTGKTLAASYIATVLSAPLYRVDLSAVMNKYIGESEKNLAQLLDLAAALDVILLFDEADALFGQRNEGKESGERYANMLTNYLLTRVETHPGIVILTTNSRERIDDAFNRRINVVVEFPLPGFAERLHLWQSHLGLRGPGETVYRDLAAYCDLSGGQVRNAVLTAAVYAQGDTITCLHLWRGLCAEYHKIGRDPPAKLSFLQLSESAA